MSYYREAFTWIVARRFKIITRELIDKESVVHPIHFSEKSLQWHHIVWVNKYRYASLGRLCHTFGTYLLKWSCPITESGQPIHVWFRTPLVLVIFSLLMLLALALLAVGKYVFWVSVILNCTLRIIRPRVTCVVSSFTCHVSNSFEDIESDWVLRKTWVQIMWKFNMLLDDIIWIYVGKL